MVNKITNGFEYQGGAEDGKPVNYKVSDLVIKPSDLLAIGKTEKQDTNIRIKRQYTTLRPFSLDTAI